MNVQMNTNIENYLYFKKSTPNGSNDEDAIIMFKTSAIASITPVNTTTFIVKFAKADGTNAADTVTCTWATAPTDFEDLIRKFNDFVGLIQRDSRHSKGSWINVVDEVAGTSGHPVISTSGLTIAGTAL